MLQRYQPTPGDYVIPQEWRRYTSQEHDIWDQLWQRQAAQLIGRAVPNFIDGLSMLQLGTPGIPDFDRLNTHLHAATGWQVVAVPGLVPDACFFDHLANRRFPAARFIRNPQQLDYLQEPDIFHDVFGHVPMLAHPVFADYMQAYGRGGLRSQGLGALNRLARLYWYTVEFGLIATADGLKIFGAGIVSSHSESRFALESESPHRIRFDLRRVMQTSYRIDDFQQSYFVIDSFDDLLRQTIGTDFAPIYRALDGTAEIDPGELQPTDALLQRGTQRYALAKAQAKG